MAGYYERCGAKQVKDGWKTCNRKAGHTGQHADTKHTPPTYWNQDLPIGPRNADGSFEWLGTHERTHTEP